MNNQRKIIHVDMDCFYAAVEMRDDPSLRNVPIAVGGNGPRSVLCTCNYKAREYGVRSAMSNVKAKQLCPELIIVNGRMSVYKDVSLKIREIFLRYTDLIEPLSLDEAYLDVSDCKLFNGSATLIAEQIRADIFTELNLTASAGIAPNKFLAKIASDENKPNGQFVITPAKIPNFVKSLPIKKIPGVGKVTQQKLAQKKIFSGADVQQKNEQFLIEHFGKLGKSLWQRCHGIDNRQVETHRIRKSVGVERTFAEDVFDQIELLNVLKEKLIPELTKRASAYIHDRAINKVGVKIKFNDFQQTTKECQFHEIKFDRFEELFKQAILRGNGKAVRLLGVHVGLSTADAKVEPVHQLEFF